MKITSVIIAVLFCVASLQAQTEQFHHFEVSAAVNFWTPSSLHLKTSNSVTQLSNNGTYSSTGSATGYGPSLSPDLELTYFFNQNIGVSAGFCLVNMDNELSVTETDSTFSSYENLAEIGNITLGVTGRLVNSDNLFLFVGVGVDYVTNYDLEMKFKTQSSNPPEMEATDSAIGLYCKAGGDMEIVGPLYFRAALAYTFIPVEMEYTNGDGSAKTNVKTNLGGLGLVTGLSFMF